MAYAYNCVCHTVQLARGRAEMNRWKLLAVIGLALLVIARADAVLPALTEALRWLAACEALFAFTVSLAIWRAVVAS